MWKTISVRILLEFTTERFTRSLNIKEVKEAYTVTILGYPLFVRILDGIGSNVFST